MASDGTQIILFGGSNFPNVLGDTWSYTDASGWTNINPANPPLSRKAASMAYDGTQFILFGGFDSNNGTLNDTWSYTDASGWTNLNPANPPPKREYPSMAYDGTRIILFGGNTNNGDTPTNEIWAYNSTANTWTQLS
jgi:N-acetylneuraminic acid mutarotase